MVLIVLKILFICVQKEKEKHISSTIAHLKSFTRAFCHTYVESLLKGSASVSPQTG